MMQFNCFIGEIHAAFLRWPSKQSYRPFQESIFDLRIHFFQFSSFFGMNEGSVFSKFVLFLQSLEIVDGLGMPVSFISTKANSAIDFCRTNSATKIRAHGTFGITFR